MFFCAGLVFWYFSRSAHFSDSEIWSVGAARRFPFGDEASLAYKPIFNALLRGTQFFPIADERILLCTRAVFALLGILSVGFFFRFANLWSGSRSIGLWATTLYLSSSFFWSQGFTVHSDQLTVCVQLMLLGLLNGKPAGHMRRPYLWPVGFLVLLGCTPKAIFHASVLLLFLLKAGAIPARSVAIPRRWLAVFGGLLFIFLGFHFPEFVGAGRYFFDSFFEGHAHPAYLTEQAFVYLLQFARENPIILALGLFSLKPFFSIDGELKEFGGVGSAAALSLIFVVFHNDRLPFFIQSLMVFPTLWVALSTAEFFLRLPFALRGLLSILLVAGAAIQVGPWHSGRSNDVQLFVAAKMAGYLERYPGVRYYDGIAILPGKNVVDALPAPSHPMNEELVIHSLSDPRTELVFLSNRFLLYFNSVMSTLDAQGFIQVGPGVFAKAEVIERPLRGSTGSEPLAEVCDRLGASGGLYVYSGHSFLDLRRRRSDPIACRSTPAELAALESGDLPLLAFSRFDSFELPEGVSFTKVFDN